MNIEDQYTDREEQFRSKREVRAAAARAPIEVKLEKLLQLQKITSEIAQQMGRGAKTPWQIQKLPRQPGEQNASG